ncbi:hypothetical protein ABE10_31540 [Bacillus toyonensis]|nr:hypothetical protein [Bacillus toyonensis]
MGTLHAAPFTIVRREISADPWLREASETAGVKFVSLTAAMPNVGSSTRSDGEMFEDPDRVRVQF